MDTVTLVRSAIRGLLRAPAASWPWRCAGVLCRDDDYAAGKPASERDDAASREELVNALARDARALLRVLDGRERRPPRPRQARVAADFAVLAATVNLARLGALGLARHDGTWTVPAS